MFELKLDYKVLDCRNYTAGELEAALNYLGNEGWTLVTASGNYITLSRVRKEEQTEPMEIFTEKRR